MNVLIPKSRRPKFAVKLTIHDLANIPLVSGFVFVRWHLQDSARGDARGRTDKVPIKDHKAIWNYEREIARVRLVIEKDGMLSDKHVVFEVVSEHAGEKVELGTLQLNIAEFVKEKPTGRRYLLQDSKINSTIKITLDCRQLSGDASFSTPPLSSGQVFGGITGVIAEQKEKDDTLHVPSQLIVATQATPSLYRKTLTASWQRQDGELPAEECIEDLFAGGDGWAKDGDGLTKGRRAAVETALQDVVGTVPGAGVGLKRNNGEIMGWAERDDLQSWKIAGRRAPVYGHQSK
ncbi:N-terminal C2 in EEIG1 and EHBP1 proteins-domain-containing protein [Lipomyces orientalis]|uniref:N-terminal C2 in EEIG1 and EHBP1 proteins-domain-containing protein n=1 Tax=Lipomyces orientalis TaxID=1233043 RepID=A0ACC3TDF9_9ASCO